MKYENLVSYCARQEMLKTGMEKMFQSSLRVSMVFVIPMPESRRCKKEDHDPNYHQPHLDPMVVMRQTAEARNGCKRLHRGNHHSQRPDVDNCVKSILDGLNEVVFADDAIISEISARKIWGETGSTEVEIEEL